MAKPKTPSKSQQDKALSRKGAIIALIVGITVILTFLIELPQKISATINVFRATETVTPSNTPEPSATFTLAPIPSFTQASVSSDNSEWKNYLEIEPNIQCNDIVVLPQGLDYSSSDIPEKIAQAISQGYADQSVYLWNKIPEVDKDMYNAQRASTTIDINNIASDDWIEVSKSLTVSIRAEKEIPEKINAVRIGGGCGASGDIRDFPTLNLDTKFEQYTDKTVYPEFDFFKLEKGEFERFQIPFTCQATGYYHLAINIPFHVRSKAGEMQTTADVICPNEISLWLYDMLGNKVIGTSGSYFWNGSSYTSK